MSVMTENLRDYRVKFNYTQQNVADYLGITREEVSYYENGSRTIPLTILLKLSDLYGVSVKDLQEEDREKHKALIALSFRKEDYEASDFEVIASFRKIVKNYRKLKRLAGKHELSAAD